jgi:hypothetical protein
MIAVKDAETPLVTHTQQAPEAAEQILAQRVLLVVRMLSL